ncbi:MAG: S1 family peptidase [Thermoguttaceae bacterium]
MFRSLHAIQFLRSQFLRTPVVAVAVFVGAVFACGVDVTRCDQSFGIQSRQPRPIAETQTAARVVTPVPEKLNGEVSPPSTTERFLPNPAIVRIVAFETMGQLYGSGSYIGTIGQYGLIVSNWHVVSGTDTLVHVHFPTGFASFGYVLLTDRKWDLAVILVSRPPATVSPLAIAREVPRPGDPLWIAGYGAGMFRVAGGRCQRYLAPEIPVEGQPQYEYVELSVEARQGDSGGPILNRQGEVAGVLFGSDSRNTAGSHCGRVRQFLDQAAAMLDKLPTQPEGLFASVEKDGPRYPLSMTSFPLVVAAVPDREKTPTAGGIARPSSASFGIVSISRPHDPDSALFTPPHGLVPTDEENGFPQSVRSSAVR